MLSKEEQKRLKELLALKKANKLTDEDKKELSLLNKKSRNKGGNKGRNTGSEKPEFKPGNDFSWWNKFEELIRDSANFKSNHIAGTEIAGSDIPYIIPGVMKINMQPTYGCGYKATDAINVWARDLYLRMFHKYRPASGYSASDLGIAIIAGIEAAKLIAKYERIYGVVNRYSILNVNIPLVEAEALGLSVSDVNYLQSHMADFRYDLNFLIKKAQRLCLPKDISEVADAISLFGYEYLDHDNARGQIIIFDFDDAGIYDDVVLTSGGSIMFTPMDASMPVFDFSADNMCVALNTLLNGLLGSDSVQRIYADLVVWFGQEAMLSFLPVPEEYTVIPVYSESILHKIHNLETPVDPTDQYVAWADSALSTADLNTVTNGYFWVYQSDDRIVSRGGWILASGTHTAVGYDGGAIIASNGGTPLSLGTAHVLDTYRVDVTPETVVEGVMYKYTSMKYTDSGTGGVVRVVTSCSFYMVKSVQLFSNFPSSTFTATCAVYNNQTTAYAIAGRFAIVDWAPLVYNITSAGTCDLVAGDLDTIVPLYANDILRLHRTIVLSGLHTDVKVKVS